MPTFKRKAKIVDARHFTGGPENAIMLVQWIKAQGANDVSYHMTVRPHETSVVIHETIWITTKEGEKVHRLTADIEDWIILDTNGYIKPCPPNKFWDEYEEV